MRIIAGKHKNRTIPTHKQLHYRPSTTKFREALFSILSSGEFANSQPVIGAKILDLFAGTGGLAFEALSRGAESIMLVDNQVEHLKIAKEFAKHIGEESNVQVLLMNALSLLHSKEQYDLVFMDPPYYNNYVTKSLNSLIEKKWLADKAIIAIEMFKRDKCEFPDSLSVIKEKIYGNNKLLILRYGQS
ncbi:MAG: 16S rRNA (guanine(966)-N(2))-methyltransferase RsmD [Rickettsiaceae bacterium]|nr:16S rRNA (guanine(966)-N(2))-methyltransferase RsmD [Rickettsiaceae bacterium]MDP5020918.1 16S rRNA (guanine(966)-N(2))-methyltransferase RsmD [Rickettsiaceae bacterium]MDP5083616.1 16S rRNA (guanine(966)-N(2))-methyltransferase RsmD [Rickettsiaceae bacterium]